MNLNFKNADQAFAFMYDHINTMGSECGNGTRRMLNIGFYILEPLDNLISTDFRNWNKKYADRELEWYLSENRSVEELKKFAPIWDTMHNGDHIVNSNYGFAWNESSQLKKTVEQLKQNTNNRQAWITIFDGKRKDQYQNDTPCTLNIGFIVDQGKLCMMVLMRSNDLWYGFCNDQYCFSDLQKTVANELQLEVGWYYHYAADLHIYEKHYDLNK